MNEVDKLLARAQVGMAFLFATGFLSVLVVLVFFGKDLPPVANTLLTGLLGVLGTIVTMQQGFLFNRTRAGGMPADSTNTVTQTHTQPDGTRTVITSPADAPVPALPARAAPVPSEVPTLHPFPPSQPTEQPK